jgi:cysteine synthase A
MDNLIGNTPLIKINYKYKGEVKSVYTKLEYYNLTGSIKDRIAYYILNKKIKNNELKDNQPIIEATSGNTGISFAALGSYLKHPVHIFMPDWVSKERINLLKLYNANVYLVSKEEGGFKECIKRADQLAEKIDGYRPDQFNNIDNIWCHYYTTALEIINKLNYIPAFVSGIGTGGTLMGIAKRLKEYNPNIKILALEPDSMPLLSKNAIIKPHKIEGIGDDFIPSIVDKSIIDGIILINDMDAINMARLLSKKLGLGVGISSGANFLASVISGYDNIVTVFPDDSKKYLSTDLTKDEIVADNLISNQIDLINYEIID